MSWSHERATLSDLPGSLEAGRALRPANRALVKPLELPKNEPVDSHRLFRVRKLHVQRHQIALNRPGILCGMSLPGHRRRTRLANISAVQLEPALAVYNRAPFC